MASSAFEDGGDLVTKGLAAAGWCQNDDVPTFEKGIDCLALSGAERVESKDLFESGLRRKHGLV
ncbi:MAG: hypothetical protein A2289_26370 [Deltaproteobacteria bacterium RIFOXYA12_FULL_58_15]|nr:MAG: hypothetical protein A2289_26370 [Deltaproteobacteria bacterium RIFOXYA12_FULL_58_15]